ncbi:SdpA family antimicrobial peptide system protein [Streptomyces sp. HUAS TT7]|uniref:SdpA family antimicrobial peptide system protein n=1 Tax=Streptomyces sp. HUAS TT7 TaxID=3447507 RepID=UPI003F658129
MRLTDRIQLRSPAPGHTVAVPRSWATATIVAWVIACLYVAQSFLPHNVISLPWQDNTRKAATVVAPQGWAFFTKSAKDAQYAPYRVNDGKWQSAALTPHSRTSNAFGLDRASRSQGIEIALLLHQDNAKWTSCEETPSLTDCLTRAAAQAIKTTNPSPAPTLCGRAAVAEMRPTPWAWRNLSPERHTPERVVVWDVKCP